MSFILYIDKILDKYICIFKYMHHAFYFQRVRLPAHYCLLLTLRHLSHSLCFFLIWRIIALQCCVGLCHTTCESAISIPSLLRLLPTPPSHPPRSSVSTGLSSLCYMATSHWLSVSHMVMCMFQCYSLNLSHLSLPLLCPHVSVSVSLFLPSK